MGFLAAAGIEAADWGSVGERGALDTDIMIYAAAGRVSQSINQAEVEAESDA